MYIYICKIVTIATLVEYRCSFISKSDLFCDEKYIVVSILETGVQWVFRGFLWFIMLLYDTFYPFPGWIKNSIFKNGIHLYFNFYLKMNMDKISQKVTKDPKRQERCWWRIVWSTKKGLRSDAEKHLWPPKGKKIIQRQMLIEEHCNLSPWNCL